MDKKDRHGNAEALKGNQNAKKQDGRADSWIQMRVPRAVKAQYVRQANNEGMKLTEWVRKHLDKVSDNAFNQ